MSLLRIEWNVDGMKDSISYVGCFDAYAIMKKRQDY